MSRGETSIYLSGDNAQRTAEELKRFLLAKADLHEKTPLHCVASAVQALIDGNPADAQGWIIRYANALRYEELHDLLDSFVHKQEGEQEE